MKFKRVCAIIAGILNLLLALGFMFIIFILFSGAASCMGSLDWLDSGNGNADFLVNSLAGGLVMGFWFIAILFIAIPAIIFLILGIFILRANGKKIHSIGAPVTSIVFSVLNVLNLLLYIAATLAEPVFPLNVFAYAGLVISVLNIALCSFAISGILQQNDVLRGRT